MFYLGMIPRVSCFFWIFVHLSLQFIIHETPYQGSSLVQSMSSKTHILYFSNSGIVATPQRRSAYENLLRQEYLGTCEDGNA
jgi:membrane-bound acyltransferase YfiQ involved in biofilm formation